MRAPRRKTALAESVERLCASTNRLPALVALARQGVLGVVINLNLRIHYYYLCAYRCRREGSLV